MKMKKFLVEALVVFTTVLFDGSRAESVHKRQLPLPPVRNVCSDTELQSRNDSLRCSNASVGQQLLDVFAECGYNGEALRKKQECGRNEAGGFCYELRNNSTLTELAQRVYSACSSTPCGTSCNRALVPLRDSTGCCANYLITNTYLQEGQEDIPDLWSNCNLRPPDNCFSTLSFQQSQDEMVCSQREITYRLNRLFCTPNYITPFVDIMRNCSRETQVTIINRCGVNRHGRFCFEAEANVSRLMAGTSPCFRSDNENCSLTCKVGLDLFQAGVDCCINNLYNNTLVSFDQFRTTSYVLWSLCGIQSPGFCRNTIDNSSAYSVLLQVSMAATGLCTIIAMLV